MPNQSEDIFETYESLKQLNISYNFLTEIPEYFSDLQSLEEVLAFGNRISKCSLKKAPIKTIDFGQNQFTYIPLLNSAIEHLYMDFNRITSIEIAYPKLTKLCLNLNQISFISPDIVFPALLTLDISRNKLTELPDLSVLAPNLERLDASFNSITELPKLPMSIIEIRLSNNSIKNLPKDLDTYTNLTYIDFSCNKLTYVGKLPFTIQTAILYENEIVEIEECETPDLHSLEISRNCLEKYPAFRINEIAELSIFSNRIKELRADCFYEKIYKLDLSDNDTDHLPADLFKLATLVHLNVARNKIKSFPPNISSSPLIYFCISENPIEKLPDLFPIPLEQLYMANCGLDCIPDTIIRNEELIVLVAPGNNIKSVPYIPTLQRANFSCNKLTKMPIFPTSITSIDLSCNNISEITDNANFPLLRDFNISSNNVSKLPSNFFAPKLELFTIAKNPLSGDWSLSLPSLVKLDINATDINLISVPTINEVVSPHPSDIPFCHSINCGDCVSYSQRKRLQNGFEDEIIADAKRGVFGILNVSCDQKATRKVAAALTKLIRRQDSFDDQSFEQLSDDAMMLVNTEPSQGETTVALALVSEKVTVVRTGSVHVLKLNRNGDITFSMRNRTPSQPLDRRSISFYRSRDNLGVMQALGDQLVFGGDDDLNMKTTELTDDDKWIVIASDIVFNVIDENLLSKMAKTVENAEEFAYGLRNTTMGHMYNQKLSAIVLDIDKYKKGKN
ncbi:Leucine Rich Repeat family protein [Trichomonas vaginalis G3]|uniref:Leucine Rich Repeat family protein n=1 Tax=Trichomonas vaginalis (strain ATCC PRA-98 / G3) TaxID=412133 RepID=A2DBL9_TRIV3|nr:uncharacterized protein TVAGG3_0381670 [Trichomonas vaginalis G3]EAY22222.1 Leucine Rich Repeat family protein [Trichomonas vaginalis G3]KAI5533320.1 regulation of response to stimulus [Trichomonas vaginalis G3]|eukprot:XP_001583208.1 hypothetical protein [Trichomonas vaginalis G3]